MMRAALLTSAVATMIAANPVRPTHDGPALTSFELHDDFQGDGLGQWAAYPPSQDVGYDPSISPTSRFEAPGGRALARIVRPPVDGPLRIGVIKHVPFRIGEAARIRFSYRLEPATRDVTLEVGLAGHDGRLFLAHETAGDGWQTFDSPMGAFRSRSGTPRERADIDAIYVQATVGSARHDITYHFLVDNVELSAERNASFELLQPRVESMNPWPDAVSAAAYRSGDTLTIAARTPVRLTTAEASAGRMGASAESAALYDDGTHGDRLAGDDVWTNGAVRRFDGDAAPGLWTVRLRGRGPAGTVETSIRLLVHRDGGHPHLLFGPTARPSLQARRRHPKLRALWKQIEETARTSRASGPIGQGGAVFEMLDREYLLPSLLGYFDVLNRARQRIAHNAVVAYVDNDAEALTAARSALRDVAAWSRWQPPWFDAHGQHTYYPAGQLATAVAIAYDLLFDRLTPAERDAIRGALIERSILPTWREYVRDNRVMANTSNWIAHTVGGALLAAAAIDAELTPAERARVEPAVGGLLLKLESHMAASFLADGSYGEGISYQEFDLETLGLALTAIERVYGIDYWSTTHVLESLAYPMHVLADPVSESLDMGDTHAPAGHGIAPVVYRSRSPQVRWYGQQFTPRSITDFLFFNEEVDAAAPTGTGSRVFASKGSAVFRTGWGANDMVLLVRAGPTANHNHSDQGSFLFRAFGETLATEAGWSDYYKDPHYATYFTQAAGHNTVLISGNPASQPIADTAQFASLDAYPRITSVLTSAGYDALTADLTPLYRGSVNRHVRWLVFVKPHYLIVADDLAVPRQTTFDWLLHVPDRSGIEAQSSAATYHGTHAALAIKALGSIPGSFVVRDGRLPYGTLATATPPEAPARPGILDFATQPASSGILIMALAPARDAPAAVSLSTAIEPVQEGAWRGVRVHRGQYTDHVLFEERPDSGLVAYGSWRADAGSWSFTLDGDDLSRVAAEGARRIERHGRVVLASDEPVDALLERTADGLSLSVTAAAPATIEVMAPPGSHAEVDGAPAIATGSSGTLEVRIPAGTHTVSVR